MGNPFVLDNVDKGQLWTVSWPGFEYVLVNNIKKACTLLSILFDTVKVDQVKLTVHRTNSQSPDFTGLLYLNSSLWFQDRDRLSEHLSEFTVLSAVFDSRREAEHFKLLLEQRLMWRRLGGSWSGS